MGMSLARTSTSPAEEKIAVNLATDVVFPAWCRGIYVGVGGTVIARAPGSTAFVTYQNVPNGGYLDGYFAEVKSTANGTTASGLIADF